MDQIQYPSINSMLSNYNQGLQAGQNALNQRTSRQAGQAFAKGDYKSARNAFYNSGQIAQGLQVQKYIQGLDDRARQKVERVTKLIGNVAMSADTPEKWQIAINQLKQRGMDVSQWEDFSTRDLALAETGKTLEMLNIEAKRREMAKNQYIKVDKNLYDPENKEWLQPPAAPQNVKDRYIEVDGRLYDPQGQQWITPPATPASGKDRYIEVDGRLYDPQAEKWISPPAAGGFKVVGKGGVVFDEGQGKYIIPPQSNVPGANMPKAMRDALAREDAKKFTKLSEAATSAAEMRNDIGALKAARSGTDYEGSILNNWFGRTVGRNIGDPTFTGMIPSSKDVQAIDTMDAISGRLVQNAAKNLKGALSDKDIDLLWSTVPGSGMTDAAADNVIRGVEAGIERAEMRASMYDAWLQTYGNARGFSEAWSRFAAENPVFKGLDASGKLVLNQTSPDVWRNYLPNRNAPAPGTPNMRAPSGNRPLPPGGFPATMRPRPQPGMRPRPQRQPARQPQPRQQPGGNPSDMSSDELRQIILEAFQ